MAQKSIELESSHQITIETIGGDLHIKGWQRSKALFKTSSDKAVKCEENENGITLSCPVDCTIFVPHSVAIEVGQVVGCAGFKSLDGTLKLGDITGELSLRDVGNVEVQSVGGGLSAKRTRGDLQIQNVSGSANIRDVDGQFSCQGIGGNLRLSDVSGGISATVGGDARIYFSPVPWQAYAITAGGNLRCYVPEDINAEISFTSGAQSIRIKLPNHTQPIKEADFQQVLGEGGTPMTFSAGGKIDLIGTNTDWSEEDFNPGEDISNMAQEIARQTTEQIEAHLGALDSHLSGISETLEQAGLPEERSKEIRQRLEQARERATRRAQESAQRAQAKLERKLAAAQRKAERAARRNQDQSFRIDVDAIRAAASKSNDPVSDEERMLILQMLQDQKISLEQAEDLLSALDGSGD